MVTVDLRAEFVPSETRIWRLFPGKSYKFLPVFDQTGRVFLDFPGLKLPEGDLVEAEDWIPRIVASESVIDLKRKFGPDIIPEIDLADFQGARRTRYRSVLQQSLINLFKEARQGDYVIVPSSLSEGRIRIGQFARQRGRSVIGRFEERYGLTPIPARSINWLARVPEHQVSSRLRAILRHENPFSLLGRSLINEVLSFVHETYCFGDTYSAIIYNDEDDYLDREIALIGLIAKLSAAFYETVEKHSDAPADVLLLLVSRTDLDYSCAFSSDIHSSGFTRFVGAKPISFVIACVIAAVLAFSDLGDSQEISQAIDELNITNSSMPENDPCIPLVSEATKRLLRSMDAETLWEMCQQMRESQERAKIRQGVTVTNDDDQ